MERTYSQLEQENELLRRLACLLMQTETIPALAAEVATLSIPEPEPEPVKLRVKAEAYEFRISDIIPEQP